MIDYEAITLDTRIADCVGVFSNRLRHTLMVHGINTIADLCTKRRLDILCLHNISKRGLEQIERMFDNTNFHWEYVLPVEEYVSFAFETDWNGSSMTIDEGVAKVSGKMKKKEMVNFLRNVPTELFGDVAKEKATAILTNDSDKS